MLRLLVYSLILASGLLQLAIVPILPAYAHRFALTGFDQGMLLAATGLATLVVAVPAGAFSDRLGARRMTLLAGALMALASVLQALAPTFGLLFVARLVFGLGYGILWTAGLAWLADCAPSGSSLGGSVASAGIGGIVGPALFGVMVQYLGLAVPFIISGAVFALLTVVLARLRLPASAPSAAPATGTSLLRAAMDRATIVAAGGIVAATILSSVANLLVPEELHAAGDSLGMIGLAFSAGGVLFALGSISTASLGRRAVHLSVALTAMAAMVLAAFPAALSVAPAALILMLCGMGGSRSVVWTVSYPLGAEGAEHSGVGVGMVMGLLNGVWAATAVASPLVAGFLAERSSARAVFAVAEVASILVLATAFLAAGGVRPLAERLRGSRIGAALLSATGSHHG